MGVRKAELLVTPLNVLLLVLPKPPPATVKIVYVCEGAKPVPSACTLTVAPVNVAVPPTVSLLACVGPALIKRVEPLVKPTLPVTVKLPNPPLGPGDNWPPLFTTSPLMVPTPNTAAAGFTVTVVPVSTALIASVASLWTVTAPTVASPFNCQMANFCTSSELKFTKLLSA